MSKLEYTVKSPKKLSILFCLFILTSCYESLDFDQIDDYVSKPIFTSALTYFTVVPAKFFDSTGTIQQNSITEITNFDAFQREFIIDNLVKIDFNATVKNEFDRDVTINIEFLSNNNNVVYTFEPIFIKSKELNFTYLEEIDIVANRAILKTTQIKITAELEDTGIQMDLNDLSEFEFKSSVTLYIESSLK